MKISLNWIKEFVDLNINPQKASLEKVVVGFVESMEQHPNADRLRVAQVNIGDPENIQIVCGGANLTEKTFVPVALPGAVLPGNFAIKKSSIRGVESNGMICSETELNIGDCEPKNIMILDKKTSAGTAFSEYLGLKGHSPHHLANLLTLKTAEVEEVVNLGESLKNIVSGKLESFKKVANTDTHHEAIIDIGKEKITVVFGSVFQLEAGWILPIALPGAITSVGEIKESEIKGVKSQGMICADKEMGIENSSSGLTIFPANTPLGTPVSELLFLNDFQLEIDNKSITHRPDLWGHYGIAREMAALTGEKLKPYQAQASFPSKGENLTIKIEDPVACPRFTACLIENIKIEESPAWIKGRLQSAGIRPVNNIVDVTNYVMLEYGQPMHAYDRDLVKTDTIVVKFPDKETTVETIDHKQRKLNNEDIIVTNGEKFLGVAGIMGGLDSEINENTSKIILEAANWHASTLRKTSQKLGLRSDASQRFEKSLDPEMCPIAVTKAVEIIMKICPNAKVVSPLIDANNSKNKQVTTQLSIQSAQSKIGKLIPASEMKSILESLEFKVTEKDKDTFLVEVPSFRATKDVAIEEDLIEEVARMHGYSEIDPILPTLPIKVPAINKARQFENKLKDIFSQQLNFSEIYNYSFYSLTDIQNCLLPEAGHIQLDNYLSEDQTHMRVSLIPNLLKAIKSNLRYFEDFKLYETGKTYLEIDQYFPQEEKFIAGSIVLGKKSKQNAFFQLKGALENWLQLLGHQFEFKKSDSPANYAHPVQVADIVVSNTTIGQMFSLHPLVQQNLDLNSQQIALFEVNIDKILSIPNVEKKFAEINKFPDIQIDVSVVVKKKKTVGELMEAIKGAEKELISNVEVFDIYEGPNIDVETKAIAFRITLQAQDRTLTEAEMTTVQDKIFKRLIAIGGKIRGL